MQRSDPGERRCPIGFLGTFLVASAAPTQALYSNHGGICEPETLDPGAAVYAIGAVAQLKSLSRVPRASGGGRLEPLRYSDGRVVTSAVGFYDTQLGTICSPTELADGTTRCVPRRGLTSSAMFSDARCETPIHVANVRSGVCPDSQIPDFAVDESAECLNSPANQVIHEVRRVVGSYPGPVYRNDNPGCSQLTGFTSYQLSDPIPLDQLAAATRTTDP